jgi:hypothetical protein
MMRAARDRRGVDKTANARTDCSGSLGCVGHDRPPLEWDSAAESAAAVVSIAGSDTCNGAEARCVAAQPPCWPVAHMFLVTAAWQLQHVENGGTVVLGITHQRVSPSSYPFSFARPCRILRPQPCCCASLSFSCFSASPTRSTSRTLRSTTPSAHLERSSIIFAKSSPITPLQR